MNGRSGFFIYSRRRFFAGYVSLLFFVCVFLIGFFASCRRGKDERFMMLFVPKDDGAVSLSIERGMRDEALKQNVDLVVSDYPIPADPESQIKILNAYAAAPNISAIVIDPVDSLSLIEPLRVLHARGIHVFTVSTYIGDGDYHHGNTDFLLTHIGTDEASAGRDILNSLVLLLDGRGTIYINSERPDEYVSEQRLHFFRTGIDTFPSMRVIGVDYNYGSIQTARSQTISFLLAHPDVDAVFSMGIPSSEGLLSAVHDTGTAGVLTVGCWTSPELVDSYFEDGTIDILLKPDTERIGRTAVETMVRFLRDGTAVPKRIQIGLLKKDRTAEKRQPEARRLERE